MLLDVKLKQKIVLASASPRRLEILKNCGLDPEVVVSDFEETLPKEGLSHENYSLETARGKALSVFQKLKSSEQGEVIIIAADTIVSFENQILEKPRDGDDAMRMLEMLSGKEHRVITGCVLVVGTPACGVPRIVDAFSTATRVYFATLEKDLIRAYIATGDPMDKAGGYGIQSLASSLISRVDGCFYNVMGLPAHGLTMRIRQLCVH